ncbi:MAG: FAD-binding oxidoreductase, partial [Ktedonobacteraceae bacterium]|nr:FAD-binding oxidoreductase [Ktedonobacteraceae bacterium]
SLADVTHVGYEPESGFADPNATIYSFARATQDMGVELQLNTEVTRILVEGQRVTGVETSNGIIQAPTVVIVAGAWANNLLAPLHIDLGLTPRRAKVVVFRWSYERAPQHLTYLDRINLMWARPIDDNCTLVGVDLEHFFEAREPDTYPEAVEQAYIDVCREQLAKRFPAMRHSTMRGNWACMLMQSPDGHPMIGSLPQYTGLFCMAGDSGTSFKTSPAIGKCLGELITEGQATTVDLTPFRPSRFSEGAPWHDDFDYGNHPITISR